MSKHIGYFDFLRGVAILMVVGIHTFPKCSWDDPNDYLLIVLRQLLNCAVPIFLALSAFFLAKKSFHGKDDVHSFWKRQITKVYIPCLIWSIPLFFLAIKNGANLMIETIRLFICGYSIYYFIALIIQCYLLLPALIQINKWGGVILALLSICSVSIYLYMGWSLPLILFAGPCIVWIMFFGQGILMGKSERNYSIPILVLLLLITLVLQVIESYYLSNIRGSSFGIKGSAFLYSSIVLFMLFSKQIQLLYESKKNVITTSIEYIGKLSFGVYLIHCYVITMIDKTVDVENWGIKWMLTGILSIGIILFIKLIVPHKYSSKYLGFL